MEVIFWILYSCPPMEVIYWILYSCLSMDVYILDTLQLSFHGVIHSGLFELYLYNLYNVNNLFPEIFV